MIIGNPSSHTQWTSVNAVLNGVSIVCFLISLYVLNQVFFPLKQGNQYYLMWFLAFVLPLVFICYRPGFGRR